MDIRHALRRVLGGGADNSITNPLYVSAGSTFIAILREALASLRHNYSYGFYAFHFDSTFSLNQFFMSDAASDIDLWWTLAGIEIPPPSVNYWIASSWAFMYPQAQIEATWEALAGGSGDQREFALRGDWEDDHGLVALVQDDGNTMILRSANFLVGGYVDITALLPGTWQTDPHFYMLKANKWGAELYVDGMLLGVIVYAFDSSVNFATAIAGPPYAIVVNNFIPTGVALNAMLRAQGTAGDTWGVPHSSFTFADGDPCPPRRWPLYDGGTNNLFAGLVLPANPATSHPVPVFGYQGKTLLFQATGDGTITIETFTAAGIWTDYDNQIRVQAATLKAYRILSDMALIRVTYTPDGYPATITYAEVIVE